MERSIGSYPKHFSQSIKKRVKRFGHFDLLLRQFTFAEHHKITPNFPDESTVQKASTAKEHLMQLK